MSEKNKLLNWRYFLILFVFIFGLATLKEGGSVLFLDGEARAQAGNIVPFVLWFNFFTGFIFLLIGIGLIFNKKWIIRLSFVIASCSLLVLISFWIHVLGGGLYEKRTAIAMTLRTSIWILIYFVLKKTKKL